MLIHIILDHFHHGYDMAPFHAFVSCVLPQAVAYHLIPVCESHGKNVWDFDVTFAFLVKGYKETAQFLITSGGHVGAPARIVNEIDARIVIEIDEGTDWGKHIHKNIGC